MYAHMRGTELKEEEKEPYVYGFDTYIATDPSQMVNEVQWVYKWENPDFYNMLVQQ
jgi:hypothetical protein